MNLGWLLLILGLGLSKVSCCFFGSIWEVVKHEPRPAIHMEKQLGLACKLGGAESLGISKVGQTVLARLMECQIWHQLAGSVEIGFSKGQWPLLTLMTDTSVPPCMPLVPYKVLPQC